MEERRTTLLIPTKYLSKENLIYPKRFGNVKDLVQWRIAIAMGLWTCNVKVLKYTLTEVEENDTRVEVVWYDLTFLNGHPA
tara:strand:- start:27 stop:269 length:243 start_codon:yes stop_codon:yes gene_type:complete